MNAAKQRLILYEIESPGLATIRGIMLLAALSKWVVAERLAQTQIADLTAFARPVNANGDDRQGWLLLGMATRLSEDCTFASSLSLCSEADLDLLQSTAGLVRFSSNAFETTRSYSLLSLSTASRSCTPSRVRSHESDGCDRKEPNVLDILRESLVLSRRSSELKRLFALRFCAQILDQ